MSNFKLVSGSVCSPDTRVFNGGKSRTVLNWSPIAQAYYVFREDGVHLPGGNQHQGNLRIHNEFDEAKRDYGNRLDSIQQMEDLLAEAERCS